jgi:hypothetical protein
MGRKWTAGVALLLAFVMLVPVVSGDGDDETEWEDEERRLEIREETDRFELRSDLEGEDGDRIRLRLDGDNIRFRFDLQEEIGSVESEAEMRVELERVFEFRDENGDGRFDAGDDVREEYDQGELELVDIAPVQTESGGVEGWEVTALYDFVDFPGSTLAFRVTAFGNLTTFQGLQQRPVDLKLDLVFVAFPYTEGDTLPGIELKLESEAHEQPEISGTSASFTAGNLTAVFSWKTVAEVDGVETDVGTTVVELPAEADEPNERVFSVTYAYARGADITHDPTFGFLRSPFEVVAGVLGDVGLYLLGVLAAVAVFAALAVTARRRKVKEP